MDIKKIRINDQNPRLIKDNKFKKLCNSIQDFPNMLELRPIIVDSDGMILGGNMRFRALKELGMELKEEWFKVADKLTDEEKRRFIVEDNVGFGEWDWEKLSSQFDAEELKEWGLDEVEKLYADEITEDEPPALSDEPAISKDGEVYQLGEHRLICGDSTKVEVIEKLMAGEKADCIFTDPPYNVNYGNTMKDALRHKVSGANAGKTILNDHFDDHAGFELFLTDALIALSPFVCGDVYVCMSSSELHTLYNAFIKAGGHWSTFIIWVKNTFTIGRSNYQRQYEPILYGWFDKTTHYWSGARNLSDVYKSEIKEDIDGSKWLKLDGGIETDIMEFPKPTKSKEHPTMKPIALCVRCIKNSTVRGGVVLDSFGGSGSTLIACEEIGRKCRIAELDPKYCDVIRKRYAKFIDKEESWETVTPKI